MDRDGKQPLVHRADRRWRLQRAGSTRTRRFTSNACAIRSAAAGTSGETRSEKSTRTGVRFLPTKPRRRAEPKGRLSGVPYRKRSCKKWLIITRSTKQKSPRTNAYITITRIAESDVIYRKTSAEAEKMAIGTAKTVSCKKEARETRGSFFVTLKSHQPTARIPSHLPDAAAPSLGFRPSGI